jgi:hypothetical protein
MNAINKFLQESKDQFTIYCDMDGVLTNFPKAVEDLGHGSLETIEKKYGENYLWKIVTKAGIKFWSEMEWMPDGRKLWDYIKDYHPYILSAPIKAESSKIGKKIWVEKNLGSHVKLILAAAKDKHKYATPKSILIDDRDSNIKEWKNAGGIAIQHFNTDATLQELRKILNDL